VTAGADGVRTTLRPGRPRCGRRHWAAPPRRLSRAAAIAAAAPPASQNTNFGPLVEGPAITLAGRHTKVRREGFAE